MSPAASSERLSGWRAGLRAAGAQALLSELAACACIGLVASADHVNAPLLWDKQARACPHALRFDPDRARGLLWRASGLLWHAVALGQAGALRPPSHPPLPRSWPGAGPLRGHLLCRSRGALGRGVYRPAPRQPPGMRWARARRRSRAACLPLAHAPAGRRPSLCPRANGSANAAAVMSGRMSLAFIARAARAGRGALQLAVPRRDDVRAVRHGGAARAVAAARLRVRPPGRTPRHVRRPFGKRQPPGSLHSHNMP